MTRRLSRLLLAAACAAAGVALLALPSTARAQTLTTGAIGGAVTDAATGEPLAGVTVIVASPALQGEQIAITDEDGRYKLTSLPPGDYVVTFVYAELTVRRPVTVSVHRTAAAFVALDTAQAVGEVITIESRPPAIDPSSTTQGVTLDASYTRHLPVGRSYDELQTATAGASADDAGVSFSGSSSLENQYVVDGLNTTTLLYGQVGSPVVNEFVAETEIITGGYNAEHGRSTGGVINVVTKSGSNTLRGSVFGYVSPGATTAGARRIASQTTSIDAESEQIVDADVGVELGGPIVRDRLWFYVGVAPAWSREHQDRVTKRRVDVEDDGVPDVDPATGFLVFEELDRQRRRVRDTRVPFVAKLNGAVTPAHQGQLSLSGSTARGNELGVNGLPEATHLDYDALTTDLVGRWTSKLGDGETELEAVAGWHRSSYAQAPRFGGAAAVPRQNLYYGDLGTWGTLGGESAATVAGCTDGGPDDPYPEIRNCPDEGESYAIGGPGALADATEERRVGRLGVTQRVRAAGHHELKAGVDVEDNVLRQRRQYSGDMYFDVMLPTDWSGGETYVYRYVRLASAGNPEGFAGRCPDSDQGLELPCEYLGPTDVVGETFNWAAYLRDSWQVLPNLTVNLGLRYEEQRLRYARSLQDTVDPLTGEHRGKDAMVLDGMWAPRIGVVYDWTRQGRGKLYGHWGRYYESVPMSLNSINFGGEITYRGIYEMGQCGMPVDGVGGPDGPSCLDGGEEPSLASNVYGTGVLVAPGVRAQYLDEAILGVEVALTDDTRLGVALHDRRLGRVLEDVSPDHTETYILANPGEFPDEEADALRAQIDATTDPAERERLAHLLEVYEGIRGFDRPTRVYNALALTLSRRLSHRLFVQGSYTYARTRGNFPGLYSPDSGAIMPNITAQYDLYELLGNREGALPVDRPHDLKVDAYYTLTPGARTAVTVGGRARLASGTPVDALGSNSMYGFDESFVLPRGAIGRTEVDAGLDVHLAVARDLGGGRTLEVFTDVFNLVDRQAAIYLDETYTRDNVNPILGGDGEDLVFAKATDWDGLEPDDPMSPTRNRNFRNAEVRNPPLMARFGARLTF